MAKGGARPGAGRKKKTETHQQETMRALVRSIVTPDDMRGVTLTAVALAKSGDDAARRWLSSYILGTPNQVLDINVTIRERAQKLAEEYGLDPEDLIREAERIVAARS